MYNRILDYREGSIDDGTLKLKSMKKIFILLFVSLFASVSCSDDDKSILVDKAVVEFIETKYSGAQIRHCEYNSNGLIEVEILHDLLLKEVYFDKKNNWVYTSWDVKLSELPTVVKESVAMAYPDYVIDEADFIEREAGSVYEVELEKGDVTVVLFVTPEGVIIDSSTDEPGPSPVISDSVRMFLQAKYPGSVILDYGKNANGMLEVEFIHDYTEKDAFFDNEGNWVFTSWEVSVSSLPDAVNAVLAKVYPQFYVDNADYVERPEIVYYEIELQRGDFEQIVFVSPDGEILNE